MASIVPVFSGSYSGDLIYTATDMLVGDDLYTSIESVRVSYDSKFDYQQTGFYNSIYQLSEYDTINDIGTIEIDLVGSLDMSLMFQLIQLSKACMGNGITLQFYDKYITGTTYYCKWVNAGDFVENDELSCGGNIVLRFYKAWGNNVIYEFDSGIVEFGEGIIEF